MVGPDDGAENVARFIRNRTDAGSYHTLVDSDSILRLVPYEWEAYQDGTGSNRWAIGLSVATTAARWPTLPPSWRDRAIENLALAAVDAARWLRSTYGIIVPAHRISRAESEAGRPGFISHGARDPKRRSDPGQAFPWDLFLTRYAALAGQPGPTITPATAAPPRGPEGPLVVDGILGPRTVARLQASLNATGARPSIPVDGWVRQADTYRPDLGPKTTRALQARLNHTHGPVTIDGALGPATIRALQRSIGAALDGLFGPETTRALQRTLNTREL